MHISKCSIVHILCAPPTGTATNRAHCAHTHTHTGSRAGCRIQEAVHRRHHHHITQINALGRRLSNAELKRRFPRTSVCPCFCVCMRVRVCVLTAYDFVIKCCYKQTGRRHAHAHSTLLLYNVVPQRSINLHWVGKLIASLCCARNANALVYVFAH